MEINVDIVLLIEAETEEILIDRAKKVFMSGGLRCNINSYEEDEEGGLWKIITNSYFDNVSEVKKWFNKARLEFEWLLDSDSYLVVDGEYLYSSGEWIASTEQMLIEEKVRSSNG